MQPDVRRAFAARVNASFLPSGRDARLHHLAWRDRQRRRAAGRRGSNQAKFETPPPSPRPRRSCRCRDPREVAALAFLDAHVGRDRSDVTGEPAPSMSSGCASSSPSRTQSTCPAGAVARRRIQTARERRDQPDRLASSRRPSRDRCRCSRAACSGRRTGISGRRAARPASSARSRRGSRRAPYDLRRCRRLAPTRCTTPPPQA